MSKYVFRSVTLILVVTIMLGWNPLKIRAQGEMDFQAIEDYLLAEMERSNIPGLAVSIVKGDQVVFIKGYGSADPSGREVTEQTPFFIGSVTKSFTALAVMQLVEAGKIELDTPVQEYLPWFRVADPEASARITVRHLLNQTSGLPNMAAMGTMTSSDGGDDALEKHVRYLANAELNRPVGEAFEYSNANYIILGMIVQTVSGQSYESYVQDHIFVPLEMRHSFVSQEEALQQGLATGHRWLAGIPVAVTFPYNRGDLPAGFVITSAEDMAHFLIAQMNEGRYKDISILSPEGMELMHAEPLPGTYGMGWYTYKVEGRTLIGHEGATFNFQSAVFLDPQTRVGVFLVANVMAFLEGFSPQGTTTHRMGMSVLNLALGDDVPEQGMGIVKMFWIVNGIVLFLTFFLLLALVRIPRRYRRLSQRGTLSRFGLAWRIVLISLLHFAWTLPLLYFILTFPALKVTLVMQPDLGWWLIIVAIIVFFKGVIEIVMLGRVFAQND